MRRSLLLWLIIVLIPITAHSQSCGLADTILIQNNSTSSIDLNISDYFNNDLSDPGQGLCGIELHFFHQLSENLEVAVTSPAGQTIDLIGPNTDDPFAFTFFTKWKITFVPCAATAVPDSGYVAQWDNDQPNNFVSGGQYDGSYYPYNGCLEDFNTGPVNGIWSFIINNNPSSNPGAFVFIRLLFCDTDGVDCCFAVPGEIDDPDLLTCEGDSSLIFDPGLSFVSGPADTSEYGYQFTIFEDSLLIAYDTTMNLLNYPAGQYEVCGLSYRLTELDSLPIADGTMPLDSLRDNLNSFDTWFCGKLTDSCMLINIVAAPAPVNFEQTICVGDSLMVGDTSLFLQGLHNITLLNYAGCDSIVNVNLILEAPPLIQLDSVICLGDSTVVGNSVYYLSGLYSDTLQTFELGCDSIINLNLTVVQPVFIDTTVTICMGESYVVGDSTFTETGSYSVLMASSLGCDSTVNLTLSVLEVTAAVTDPDIINCYNSGIFLDGSGSQPIGLLTYDWYNLEETLLGSGLLLPVGQADTIFLEVSATENMTTCINRDTVIIIESFQPPTADAGLPDTITCLEPTQILGGPATSMGGQIDYQWDTFTGNFVSVPDVKTPTVDGAGLYTFVVTDLNNGCRDTSDVLIEIDTITPMVEAGDGFEINCLNLDGMLFSAGSSVGPDFDYSWSGSCIDSQSDIPDVTVSCAGTYFLEIINTQNGCSAQDSVTVSGNHAAPLAIIALPDTLSCNQNQIVLDAGSSTPMDSLLYQWTGPGIISPNDITTPIVNMGGIYTLTVTNQYNFCTDTANVLVEIDTIAPVADAGQDGILTCNLPELPLGGTNTSIGPEFTYFWVTSEGNFTGPVNTVTTTADSSGVYQLVVINEINGCRDTSTVIFGANQEVPFVDAGADDAFTCGDEMLLLDGTGSDTTQNVIFQWAGPCIETPSDSLIIGISCAGTYFLEFTNTASGCIGQDTVVISTDPAALFAELPDSAFISCESGEVLLDGSASSLALYQWFLNGAPIGLTGNSPTVEEQGFYQLVVSNLNQTCIDTAGITVVLDCDFELALQNVPAIITCGESISVIEVSVSPPNPNYEYNWTGPAPGCIVEELNAPAIEVRCAGSYALIVTNPAVGISDTIIIEILANEDVPIANAGPSDTLTCLQETVFLDGSQSSVGLSVVYVWTPVSDPTDTLGTLPVIPVDVAGVYFLEVTDTLNNCSAFDVVQVFQNNTIPDIVFGSSVFLCESDTFALQSYISPASDYYEYNWIGNGIISSDTSTVLIDTTGQFILEVEDILSGCTAIDTVTVVEQICVPCIEILPPDTLTCLVETIVLQGTFCQPCVDCTVEWTTSNGQIISGNTSLNPVVAMPGIYAMTTTDTLGFSATISVEVIGQFTLPDVFAGSDREITCDSTEITIGSQMTSNGSEFSYGWSSLNGTGVMPVNEIFTTVAAPDTFILEVQNTLTGCINEDSVVVTLNTLPPVADAGTPQLLTCDISFVILDGSASSLGNNFSYNWQAPNGNCLTGATTLGPIVSCEGNYLLTVTDMLNGCTDTSSVFIGLAEDIPEIEPIEVGVLDCQTASIMLTGNTPFPATDYLVLWCPLDELGNPVTGECVSELDLEVTVSGDYQFQVTNIALGCMNEMTVTITQDTLAPLVDAGMGDTLLCNLDSLVLSGTASPDDILLEFMWTADNGQQINNEDSLNAIVFEAGLYFLEVTNTENHCNALDSVLISLDVNTPIVAAEPDTLLTCEITEIELQAMGSASSGNSTVFWTTTNGNILSGDTTLTPVINQPGWYYLTVLDTQNGCTSLDSLFVDELILPPIAIVNGAGTFELTCFLDTILIDGSSSQSTTGAALNFQWQVVDDGHLFDDLTSDTVWVDEAGLFRLIVIDTQNGCLDSLDFSVLQNTVTPEISYEPPLDLNCVNEEVFIDASATDTTAMSVSWSTEQGGVILEDEFILVVTESEVYMITVIDEENGCETTEDIFVDIDTISPTVFIEPVNEMLDCEVRQVKIDARNSSTGSQYEYQWMANPGLILSGQDSLVIFAGAIGLYTLQITNTINGCTTSQTVEVEESAAPLTGVLYSTIDPGCLNSAGGSISIDSVMGGTPPFLYSFNGSSFTSLTVYSGLFAGVYELIILDKNGCEWEESITLLEAEELIIDLGVDIELILGDSIELEALVNLPTYDTLYWMPSEVFENPSNPVQVLSPEVTTAYSVFVVDENGCTASDVIIINLVKPRQFFIPNIFSPANLDGNNDIFMIFGGPEVKEILIFQIYDRWGNLVYENENFQPNNPAFGWDGTLDGRLMNSSVFAYYVKMEFVDGWIEDVKGDVILMR